MLLDGLTATHKLEKVFMKFERCRVNTKFFLNGRDDFNLLQKSWIDCQKYACEPARPPHLPDEVNIYRGATG